MSARLALTVYVLVGGPGGTWAGEVADCSKETSQYGLNMCHNEVYQQADARLNRVYAQLSAKHDPAERKMLRDAQRAWVEFRDKECAFETIESAGGSIRPMLVSQCLTALTNRRTRELEIQRDCKEDLCTGE